LPIKNAIILLKLFWNCLWCLGYTAKPTTQTTRKHSIRHFSDRQINCLKITIMSRQPECSWWVNENLSNTGGKTIAYPILQLNNHCIKSMQDVLLESYQHLSSTLKLMLSGNCSTGKTPKSRTVRLIWLASPSFPQQDHGSIVQIEDNHRQP
jgi:hypothetical protein